MKIWVHLQATWWYFLCKVKAYVSIITLKITTTTFNCKTNITVTWQLIRSKGLLTAYVRRASSIASALVSPINDQNKIINFMCKSETKSIWLDDNKGKFTIFFYCFNHQIFRKTHSQKMGNHFGGRRRTRTWLKKKNER